MRARARALTLVSTNPSTWPKMYGTFDSSGLHADRAQL